MSDNIEMIGNIKLDLTHYPGEDFYCDGAIEDEILDVVRCCPPSYFQAIVSICFLNFFFLLIG